MIRNVSPGANEGISNPPSVDGFYCAAPGTAIDARLTQAVLASIRVTADLARPRQSFVPTPAAPAAPPPSVAAVVPPATGSLLGWTAPVGTRFVATRGYFQITGREGATAITVNADTRTARWVGGLLVPRPGARINSRDLAPLLPLAVGKEASFEEVAGDDRWHYTVRVSGTESIRIAGQSYSAFVIEVRDRSTNPYQGGVDRTRTIWVSPEAGGILRYRTVQHSGLPAPSFNFEIAAIVPPS